MQYFQMKQFKKGSGKDFWCLNAFIWFSQREVQP